MEKGIDTDLYSRQIGAFGMETMGKLIQLKILIVGMRGLGVEVAKNIILSGPKSVSIYDPVITKINDLSSNFYLSEEDVGNKFRDEASLHKLCELNPYVKVDLLRFEKVTNLLDYSSLFCEQILQFNVVVFTELQPVNFLIQINNTCRQNNIKFIYSCNLGLAGYIFTDFGPEHIIIKEKGTPLSYNIKNITKDLKGLIIIDDDNGKNTFKIPEGDYVLFSEVEGMNELNGKLFQIEREDSKSFRILVDTSNFNDYIKGGKVTQFITNEIKSYFDYSTRSNAITDNMHQFLVLDNEKMGRSELLYMILMGIHDYYVSHNCTLPELNNLDQAREIEKNVKQFYDLMKQKNIIWYQNIQQYDEKVVLNIIRWSRAEISPIAAFFGGIISQEIIKATGKYEPIDQWLMMDFLEIADNIKEEADRSLKGTRYDDQIAIFGNEIQKKIESSKIFMVGAGATGCEFLKNFAMMGFCTSGEKSKFTVTDNDNIEISNLSRQFLFRKRDVGHSKSETAIKNVKKMNPKFNALGLQKKVCEETEDFFDEEFWLNQDFIIMAVDSNNARKYIDTRVVKFERCSVDAGTKGIQAKSQIIVPHITTNFDSADSDNNNNEVIPMCTLRHFPSQISHCIEWSRELFNDYFISTVNDIKNYFTNFELFKENIKKEGSATENLEKLNEEKKIINFVLKNDFDKVIEFAVKKYTDNFDWRIQQLLYNFPPDYKTEEGKPFWSGSKKLPHNIPYNPNDDLCFLFVKNYSIIISRSLGLSISKEQLSEEYIRKVSSEFKIPTFIPKIVKIDITENNNNENNNTNQKGETIISDLEEDEKKCEKIFEELSSIKRDNIDGTKIKVEELEKDHDENGHIDFIHASSNLRARNYNITECNRPTTKIIAGKIIPTILTTTATVAGHVSFQLYTLLQTHEIHFLRNIDFTLSDNFYAFMEPSPPEIIKDKLPDDNNGPVKVIPKEFTIWDKLEIKGSKTCKELFDYMKEKYNINIDILVANGQIIISSLNENEYEQRKGMTIEKIFLEYSKMKLKDNINYLLLQVVANIEKIKIYDKEYENASVEMPPIKYIFK